MTRAPGLIVGAGPVGLTTALLLTRRGIPNRLIDARSSPTTHSKALAINPRTLELLEPTGVTQHLLAHGRRIRGAQVHHGERLLGTLSFAGVHRRHPYMLALSQATSEALLLQGLEEAGGSVECDTRLTHCSDQHGQVDVVLESPADASAPVRRERLSCRWLLAADGAHSTVRRQMGIEFPGSTLRHDWHLADVPLKTALSEDHAHLFLRADGGILFMLRVVTGQPSTAAAPVWRVVSTRGKPEFVQSEPLAAPVWESRFTVEHRLAARLSCGSVHLAGDAAHVHSPVGARGMNLGIEDAWVFAGLLARDRLGEYGRLRSAVDRRVVRRIEWLSRSASRGSRLWSLLRLAFLPVGLHVPWVRRRAQHLVTGLDHALPGILSDTL